jgi:energy-coupling factor transporter transmembrane protein EcfT
MSVFINLDARTKLFFVLLLTFLIFFINSLIAAVCLLLSFIVIRFAAGIPPKGFKYLKNLTLLAVFIIFIQTLFGPGETYIVKPLFPLSFPFLGGAGSLKWEGFILGIVIVCRLAALMLLLPMLTLTTEPYQTEMGLCALGVNYRAAFVITAAINLIPFFREEALLIMEAQKLRGMRKFGIKSHINLLVPLMLSAMRKAQMSSVVMDSRAFGVYKTRTWLEKPKMKSLDFFFIAGSVVFFVIMMFINFSFKIFY